MGFAGEIRSVSLTSETAACAKGQACASATALSVGEPTLPPVDDFSQLQLVPKRVSRHKIPQIDQMLWR